MATYNFSFYYSISGPSGGNVNGVINNAVEFTIPDGETLLPGDEITISFDDGPDVIARYEGVSDAGEPFFTGPESQWFFASNSEYGTQPPGNVPNMNVVAFCFLAGTLLATPNGQTAVEDLAIGDLVLTSDDRAVRVRWIGRQTHMPAFGLAESTRPVVFEAGALGPSVPARDLRVTADHALLLDGLLVQAGALVNGTTIRRLTAAELGARFTVYHVELENHDLVFAEGVAAETFVDNVSRRKFANYAEYEALYGASSATINEMELPRIKSARQLPASLRDRIAERARTIGSANAA